MHTCRRFFALCNTPNNVYFDTEHSHAALSLSESSPRVHTSFRTSNIFHRVQSSMFPNRLSNCTSIFIDFTAVLSFRQAHSKYSAVSAVQHQCACLRTAGMRRAVPRRLQDHADTYRSLPRCCTSSRRSGLCQFFFFLFPIGQALHRYSSVPRLSRGHSYAEFNFIPASSFICAVNWVYCLSSLTPTLKAASRLLKTSRTVFPLLALPPRLIQQMHLYSQLLPLF